MAILFFLILLPTVIPFRGREFWRLSWASDFLGRQSSCFAFPFAECKYADFYADRDLKILGHHRQGRHECEIARAMDLDRGTVHRVLKRALVGTV